MFISVGYGGSVAVFEISAIGISDTAPTKARRRDAKRKGFLIDFTRGHPTRSILFLKNHEVVLSSLQPETLVSRANKLLIKLGASNKETPFYHDKFDLEKE